MYFGDSVFYHATSTDLLNWTTSDEPFAKPIYPWENALIEPGPAPIKTRDGRWLLVCAASRIRIFLLFQALDPKICPEGPI